MKLQIASDLHCEFLTSRESPGIEPAAGADMLILAGDIAMGTRAYDVFKDWPVPVIYVAGNHEHYRGELLSSITSLFTRAMDTPPFTFLENDFTEREGVRIIGCTLWTDYLYGPLNQVGHMQLCQQGMNDHRLIRLGSRHFTTLDALERHDESRAFLARQLAKPFDGKTVVVTHHGPHPGSVSPRFAASPINAGFVSDLGPLVEAADLWIHGHTHDSRDYTVGKCRVIANPRGYPLQRGGFENEAFDPALVVEVTPGVAPAAQTQPKGGA